MTTSPLRPASLTRTISSNIGEPKLKGSAGVPLASKVPTRTDPSSRRRQPKFHAIAWPSERSAGLSVRTVIVK